MVKNSLFQFEPINRKGLMDVVANKILDLVKDGKLAPGDRLPSEYELADTFGVSRPVIREALKGLSLMGAIKITHGSGAFVSDLSANDLLHPLTFFLTLEEVTVEKLYAARKLIEGEIAYLAAQQASGEDIEKLEVLLQKQKETLKNAQQYREVDSEFHAKLAKISDNPFLARVAQSLNILGLEFRKVASETESVLAGSVRDHRSIVDAIQSEDTEAARQAMQNHMDFVLHTTKEAMAVAKKQEGSSSDKS